MTQTADDDEEIARLLNECARVDAERRAFVNTDAWYLSSELRDQLASLVGGYTQAYDLIATFKALKGDTQ